MGNDDKHFDPEDQPDLSGLSLFDITNNYVLLLYSASCFLMYVSLSVILYGNGLVLLSLSLPAIFGIALPLYMLASRFGLSFTSEYRVSFPESKYAIIVLVIAAGSILPADAVTWVFERNRPVNEDYISFLISIKPKGLLSLFALGAGIVVISPLGEEMLFRGFIQRIFERNMGGLVAIILSALVFGTLHFNLDFIPGITLLGLLLGYIFYRTGNLVYPFIAHALFNLVSLIKLYGTSVEAIESGTRSSPSPAYLALSVIFMAAGVYLLEKTLRSGEKKDGDPGGSPST